MKRLALAAAIAATFGIAGLLPAHGQTQTQPAASTPAAQFPLAAPAGKDSNAKNTPPSGAQNQGALDPAAWKYGPAFNAPAGSKIWNPVKLKMMAGQKVTGGTVFSATDPATYCAMANAGYDFIWTEQQHDGRLGADVAAVANLPARQGGPRRSGRVRR